MAISVKCAMCGHGYQAADHMAGRRVRCKHCGNTFQLPAEAVDASTPFKRTDDLEMAPLPPAGAPLKPDPLAPPSRANAAAAAVVAAAAKRAGPLGGDNPAAAPLAAAARTPVAAATGQDSDPEADAFLQEAPDDVFDEAFQEFTTVRGNTPFVFPGSMFLDRWLPAILVVMLVIWLFYQVLIAGVAGADGAGTPEPGWVGAVRLLVLLMTYSSIVFPASLMGVRMAARKLKYELPSGAPWRAYATFLLPVTLGVVLWLSGGTAAGLIFGTMLGLIVALPVMWLLFRIRPDDAPVSLGYGAAGFGAGILGAVVLLSLLNLILYGVVKGTQAKHSLTLSPFGPTFMWEPPPNIERPKTPPRPDPDAPPGESIATIDPTLDPPPERTEPGEEEIAATNPTDDAPPAEPTPSDVATTETEQEPKAEQNFKTEMDAEGAAPGDGLVHGPIVAEAHKRFEGEMRHVAFPLIPGNAIAVVKKGDRPNEDDLELWDAAGWRATAGARFVRATGLPDEYSLSSDGSYVARIQSWPYLSAPVYSFANDKLLRPDIKLGRNGSDAHILGFCAKDQLVIQYMVGQSSRLEVWDVNRAARLKRFEVGTWRPAPNTFALSADGQLLAIIVREPRLPGRIDVYDLTTGQMARRFQVEALGADNKVVSRGLAFSQEGERVAALFENQGQGLFLCWGAGQLPMHEHALPPGFAPDGVDPASFGGEALGLLDGGRAWALYGSRLHDTASGNLLGELGISNIEAQRVTGTDSLLLIQRLDGSRRALLDVRLDIERARSGGAAAPDAGGADDGLE